jgi:hypothetical protein
VWGAACSSEQEIQRGFLYPSFRIVKDMGVDWGDVPTWVGGFFAAIAAFGAVWTMRAQRQQIDEQRDFLRAQTALLELDHHDRTAAQALRVSIHARPRRWLGDPGWWVWKATVHNASSAPITCVRVRFGEGRPPLKARWVRNAHSSLPRAPVRVDLTQDAVIPEGAWVEYTDREQWLKSALGRVSNVPVTATH